MTDEQRFDCVGYENPAVKTPHLDALAKDSLVFRKAYTTNPSCIPARAAIFTGKVPSLCGTPTFITHLPENEICFQSSLREAGYYTAAIGKQHFGSSQVPHGYDHKDIVDSHMPMENIAENRDRDSYHRFLHDNGFTHKAQLTQWDTRYSWIWDAEERFHVDAYVGDQGLRWVRENAKAMQDAGKPWYLTVSFPGPHMPYDGNGLSDEAVYREEDIDLPETGYADLENKPAYYQRQRSHGNPGSCPEEGITEEEIRRTRKAYYANQTLIDRKIGAILNQLKQDGLYENTLILYASDHGDFMGDFGLMGKGQYLSEVLMRVPFLLKPPTANPDGKDIHDPVSLLDLPATCLCAAGLQVPAEMQGQSLNGLWDPAKPLPRLEDIYMEAQDLRAIRVGNLKLIHYAHREYGELYNLEKDPWEKENLWEHPDFQPAREELRARLLDKLISFAPLSQTPWNFNAPAI